MKKIIVLVIGMVIFLSGYAQKITGVSTYFPKGDSIDVSVTELNSFIKNARLVRSEIETYDDKSMIKRVTYKAKKNLRFLYVCIESTTFYDTTQKALMCNLALLDNGELYEAYELDTIGRKYFEPILNNSPLTCIDHHKWKRCY